MTDLPSNVGYGTVIGKFLVASPDSADAGFNPDAVPATGTVTFTPSPLRLLDTGAVPPVTILPTPTVCTLNTSGVLAATEGGTGVTLLATNDPDLSPVDWTYTVSVAITGHPVYEFDMALPVGTTVDLATATPVDPSGGEPAPTTGGVAGQGPVVGDDLIIPGVAVQSLSDAANAAITANFLYLGDIVVTNTLTVSGLACYVQTGAAGNVRLGLYSGGEDWSSLTLVVDGGAVSTSTTGLKEVAVVQTLAPGRYATAIVANAAPTIHWKLGARSLQTVVRSNGFDVTGNLVTAHTFAALPTVITPSVGPSPPGWPVYLRVT